MTFSVRYLGPVGDELEGQYEVEITTGAESNENSGGKVHITLYGEKGKTEQEDLYSTRPGENVFEPGNIDKFTVS